jgi:carbon-monoxide dehydrogenase medium subunit
LINHPFEYFAPENVREALSLLKKHGSSARLVAGGQSLIPLMNLGLVAPKQLIDLTKIRGNTLSYCKADGDSMLIGAMTTHRAIETSPLIERHCPILGEAASTIADVQIRNRGTIGGSVCHADPAGDYLAPLVAVGADFHALSSKGKIRVIRSDEFFKDFFTTALRKGELLTEIRVPKQPDRNVGSVYMKHKFVEGGFAIVGVATVMSTDNAGGCNRVTVVLSGVSSTPVRVEKIEEELRGKTLDDRSFERAGQLAREAVTDPLSDIHADKEYRREMAGIFTKRALKAAYTRSRKGGAA